ncbi:MAG TPA: pentapeptide repeat-containing protein [Coleofasciculaceae cyanobacterium]|jgi:uncharacterized protein YjbI with pentapeptide repeats
MPSDFSGQNLRGCNFKGQNLSGANFTNADIRGADFANATLRQANFTKAKAGLRISWTWGFVAISLLAAGLSGSTSARSAILSSSALGSKFIQTYTLTPAIAIVGMIVFFLISAVRYGVIAALTALACLAAFVMPLAMTNVLANTQDWIFALTSALVGASLWAWAGVIARATIETSWFWVWTFVVAIVWSLSAAIVLGFTELQAWTISGVGGWIIAGVGGYVAEKAISGDSKFVFIRSVVSVVATLGGTSFYKADLTDADFTQATLKSTDLRKASTTRTSWSKVKSLGRARIEGTILFRPEVQELVTTGQGRNRTYMGHNLKGANLSGANLTDADFTEADFSSATLEGANLERANLTKTQALGTNFHQANLTGACLEAWNIDSTTQLDGAICEYVYLLNNQRERRPSSGNFAPGEFTKLFQEVLSTLDLIFRNGIDWKAFTYSFNQLVLDNEGTELSIQSIENKGDGVVVVRVNAPPNADKAKLHSEFNQTYETAIKALEARYHAELQAKDKEITIYRQQSADMQEIIRLMASRPVTVEVKATAESKAMNDSTDSSRNITVGGNLNATGSTFNLGEISGNVTNTINQLQATATPEAAQLAALLKELQEAIASSELPPADKTEALEQVNTLAKAGQNPADGTLKKLSSTAVKVIKGTIAALPDTAKLVEACSKLLPAISTLLGL